MIRSDRKSTTRLRYPNVVPRSVSMTFFEPALAAILPYLRCQKLSLFDIHPLARFARRNDQSVWRHRKAGIEDIDNLRRGRNFYGFVYISENGNMNVCLTFSRIFRPASIPGPEYDSPDKRLAFLYDA